MRANESLLERIQLAERHVGLVRAAIVGLNTVAYLTLLGRPGQFPSLANAVIGVAVLYSILIVVFEPHRRFPALLSAWTTTLTDGALITLWLVATGGFESAFFPLWYASLAAVSYRFDDRATLVAAAIYSALYAGLTLALGQLAGNEGALLVRVAYIGFVGALGALMSREAYSHIHARLEMREQMREARTAEAKFRGLLEAAPDPIVIVDRTGSIVLANSQAERAFGYAKGEMLGARVEMLLPDDVRAGHADHRERYFHAPQSRPMGIGLDLQARRKDGTRFPVEISLSPMQTEEGLLVTSIIHDVTERKKAEEERLTSLERLKELERLRELDKFKTTFINTAAHELGTPLTPIKLQLHILKTGDGAQLTARQRKALEILDRNVERLNTLVQEVLKVARLQAGRLGITKERVDLNRVVLEAVESFQEPARESQVELELHTTPGLHVDADPKRVTQVLFNLLNNAWKFTPDGGRIAIETAREDDSAVVRVRDTGQGMRLDDIEKLFQPFSQVHDTMQKTQAGTGLGLYICKGIVELHGGRIWAESPGPGLGSTFSFAIPLESKPGITERPSAKTPEQAPQPRKPADAIARRARELI